MFPLIYKIYLAPRDKFVLFIFGPGGGWEGEVVSASKSYIRSKSEGS